MKLILTFLMSLLVICGPGAVGSDLLGGDDGNTLPWPWGSECPFPWSNIEGMWEQKEPKSEQFGSNYFEFEIIDEWESGVHVFRVSQYDAVGDLVATGKGVSPKGRRIVRSVLLPVDGSDANDAYTVIVRAYTEDRCSDELVTVLTMRKNGAPLGEDVHMIVKKTTFSARN